MKVGVFLDVDGVLTVKAINLQYAQLLGIENQLIDLERRFAMREIDNDQFNAGFIPLFRNAGFSSAFARDNFDNIQMRIGADRLLSAAHNAFIVTSGPSYFIDILAERHGIQAARILCSRYEFDSKGQLHRCLRPVTSAMKGSFVSARASLFDVTVGVGDTDQDIEFLSHCTMRILMSSNRLEYFAARELQPILDLLGSFALAGNSAERRYDAALAKLYAQSPHSSNVFIMTPFRNDARYRETVQCIREALSAIGLRGWLASDLTLDHQLWDNVQSFLIGCRAGIAVFAHDKRETDLNTQAVFNPNVSIEVGYMLSRHKPVLLLKDKRLARLPTDMVGFLYSDFDLDDAPSSIRSVVHRWFSQIQ